ncbi:MAG: redox-regulated ATPase YchF [bacterium]|nr:redox-regulated ATPase YchF [bacterium]
MSLSIAIVGFPNVGKSTLFNALLKQQVALAANYPFATIEPNTGIAQVPDDRLAVLAQVVNTTVIKPATVEFVDIAGLVKGASQGAGLGNQFLSHIRETSAICHVLRAFTDADVIREGAVEPAEDLAIIRMELQLADLATLEKQKEPKGMAKPEEKERWQVVTHFKKIIEDGEMLSKQSLTAEQKTVAQELNLLSIKPEIVALNVSETELGKADALVAELAPKLQVAPTQIVVISAKIESELASLDEADQALFLEELGLKNSGLERLAAVAYSTLGLQSFLTAGEVEVRAWTISKGISAPEAAGVIHTDFTKKFIKANIASYQDFVEFNGWKGVRESGKLRMEGRDYIMQEGDIVEFAIGA